MDGARQFLYHWPNMNKIFKQIGWGGVIGLIGGGIGLLVGGLAVITAGIGAVIAYVLFCAGFIWIFWHFMFGPMVQANRLMEIGKDGDATIVSIAENGSSMQMGGALPKAGMRIVLDVRPQGDSPYQATVNTFVSMFEIQKYQPGNIVKVKIDPNNQMKLVIAEGTGVLENFSSTSAGPTPEMQAMINGLVADQQRLFKEGEEAQATVIAMTETKILINGDNPLVELRLEVHPKTGETFSAEARTPVLRASLFKLQPGKEITVKFDPQDRSKVAVYHS
jgi:hypothetical protein